MPRAALCRVAGAAHSITSNLTGMRRWWNAEVVR
jgi:hypothetical protein